MNNQFKDTKFKVEIIFRNKQQQGKVKTCVGLTEVSRFTDAERNIAGKNYVGYRSQVID
jgi:hypothetical protein